MSVLGELSCSLETATDEYVLALNLETEAENAYKLAWSVALLCADDVPATLRDKWAQAKAQKQQAEWTFAMSRRKACWAKCDELKNRIMAAMSHNKFVAAQT